MLLNFVKIKNKASNWKKNKKKRINQVLQDMKTKKYQECKLIKA